MKKESPEKSVRRFDSMIAWSSSCWDQFERAQKRRQERHARKGHKSKRKAK